MGKLANHCRERCSVEIVTWNKGLSLSLPASYDFVASIAYRGPLTGVHVISFPTVALSVSLDVVL